MLQFLQEDIPRQIVKYGKDTAIFGTNCPMQDVIIAKALELKFIMPEQCCPTPTQGFPAAMGLEITEKDAGNFAKINEQIKTKAAAAGTTGRLSTWPVAVGYFFPEFAAKLAMQKLDGKLPSFELAAIEPIAREIAGVDIKHVEIFGITSLSGHGKMAFGPGIMGLYPVSGKIFINGQQVEQPDTATMIDKGLFMLPEDRRQKGLLLHQDIAEDIVFSARQWHRIVSGTGNDPAV